MFGFFKKCDCNNGNPYKTVVEATRSSLDVNKTIKTIIEVIGQTLNADRCFIMEYDKEKDRFKETQEEYLSSNNLKSYIGVDLNEHIPKFVSEFKKGKRLIFNAQKTQFNNNEVNLDDGTFQKEKEAIEEYKVYSALIFPLHHADEFLGDLVIHYVDKKHKAGNFELDFLNEISNQISIAIYQANLYKMVKKNAERENLLFNVTEKIRTSLDFEEILSFICSETAKIFDVQRSAITSFVEFDNHEDFVLRKEYKFSSEIKGYRDNEELKNAASYLIQAVLQDGLIAIDNVEKSNTPDYFRKTYTDLGVKSILGVSVRKGKDIWGTLILSEYYNYRHWSEEDKKLLATVANEIYIAINQAELYQSIRDKANHEKILRDIMLSFVQTLDMKELIKNIVTQAGQLFNADRCFFIGSDSETNSNLPIQEYAEYLSSPEIKSHKQRIPQPSETSIFVSASEQQKVIFSNAIAADELPASTRKLLIEELSVKSYLIAPVYYGDIRYGAIVLHYVEHKKQFSDEEINIIIAIANQAAIVIHQAKLFENQKLMAERERINRNIIEILRSSLDEAVIKKQLVKNIGKLFNANRVILTEYDSVNNAFLPADINSEYLSNPKIKSYVNYDVYTPEIQEYIQPLLEKREVLMPDFNQYIEQNFKNKKFIDLFCDVKSSYSFPIIHEQKFFGFFCIEYTEQIVGLSSDDIDRIRNICTQAGIALYQLDLYVKAQEAIELKDEFIAKTVAGAKKILNNIVELSQEMSKTEEQCEKHIQHLSHINENVNLLLELTNSLKSNTGLGSD